MVDGSALSRGTGTAHMTITGESLPNWAIAMLEGLRANVSLGMNIIGPWSD